jgi:hypothetical protein
MGNLKQRVERLEWGRKGPSVAIIIVRRGETREEALARDLAEHPENEKAEVKMIISGSAPGPLSASPKRSQSTDSPPVSEVGPIQITR